MGVFPFPMPFTGPPKFGTMFTPLSLFAASEPGVWYDPSDLSTLFQDAAGTTPVTAVEQPVGLVLDKSRGLVLGSELVTNGGFDSATGWTINGAGATITGGALVCSTAATANIYSSISPASTTRTFKVTWTLSGVTAGDVILRLYNNGANVTTRGFSYLGTSGTYTAYVQTSAAPNQAWITIGGGGLIGSIDNISVRELPGSHAFQTTDINRPVLSARYNLLTYSSDPSNAVWVTFVAGTGAITRTNNYAVAPDGTTTATRIQMSYSGESVANYAQFRNGTNPNASNCTGTIYLKSTDGTDQTIILVDGAGTQSSPITVTGQWQQFSISNSGTWSYGPTVRVRGASGSATSADILVWGSDVRVTNDGVGLPAYQRVVDSTTYDTTGFPVYLRFDGTDDSLSTANIDFTSTDKMSVVAGVRKLSDAATGLVAELSSGSLNGSFALFAPSSSGSNSYRFGCGANTIANAGTGIFAAAPNTSVLTGIGSISEDICTLRRNGAVQEGVTTDQGTGNFGNYPLYIGSRGGSSLRFNGRLYSLCVVGRATTAAEITNMETWVNQRTGAY